MGLFGRKYVWILPKMFSRRWWEYPAPTNCTREQLGAATYGYFTVDSLSTMDRIDDNRLMDGKRKTVRLDAIFWSCGSIPSRKNGITFLEVTGETNGWEPSAGCAQL